MRLSVRDSQTRVRTFFQWVFSLFKLFVEFQTSKILQISTCDHFIVVQESLDWLDYLHIGLSTLSDGIIHANASNSIVHLHCIIGK